MPGGFLRIYFLNYSIMPLAGYFELSFLIVLGMSMKIDVYLPADKIFLSMSANPKKKPQGSEAFGIFLKICELLDLFLERF